MTTNVVLPESTLTKQQYKSFGPKAVKGYGKGAALWAHVRFDDECGNGHNTFAITGTVRVPHQRDEVAGGCLHEDIAKVFPELANLIKWHLCSTDGPMHYLANTLYFAGNKDHNGRMAGEPSNWESAVQFGDFPILWRKCHSDKFLKFLETAQGADFEVIGIDHKDRETYGTKYTLGGFGETWYDCPFDTEQEALQFVAAMRLGYKVIKTATAYSKGKTRELDKARNAAIWPEATDADLCASDLRERLLERLPGLLQDFKTAMEGLGFTY